MFDTAFSVGNVDPPKEYLDPDMDSAPDSNLDPESRHHAQGPTLGPDRSGLRSGSRLGYERGAELDPHSGANTRRFLCNTEGSC